MTNHESYVQKYLGRILQVLRRLDMQRLQDISVEMRLSFTGHIIRTSDDRHGWSSMFEKGFFLMNLDWNTVDDAAIYMDGLSTHNY